VTADPVGSALAEQLVGLAERRHEGVIAAHGRHDEIHFRAGRITHVRAEGTRTRTGAHAAPGEHPGDVAADVMLAARESFLDAVREFLGAESGPARWRSSRGRRPLDVSGVRLSVPAVLSEVDRRHTILRRLDGLINPETPLTRRSELPGAAMRITPEQWAVLVLVGDATTPRELAVELGDSVFRTLCRAYELVRLGLLRTPSIPDPARGNAWRTFLAS
jgi:hypothetical protein